MRNIFFLWFWGEIQPLLYIDSPYNGKSELNVCTHKYIIHKQSFCERMDKRVTVGHAGRSPPHERVDVFFHHAVERQPHPVPPPVEHVVPPVPSTDCWTHSTKTGEKEFSRYITPFLYTYNIQVPKCCNVVVWCSSRSWVAGAVENSGTVASQTPRRGQFLLHHWTDACLRCTAASWAQVQEEERVQSWTRLHCRR